MKNNIFYFEHEFLLGKIDVICVVFFEMYQYKLDPYY